MRPAEILRNHLGRRNGVRIWRLVVTRCRNGTGAPLMDDAWTHGRDSETDALRWSAHGKAFSLVRARNEHGERKNGPALFIGWAKRAKAAGPVAPDPAKTGPAPESTSANRETDRSDPQPTSPQSS